MAIGDDFKEFLRKLREAHARHAHDPYGSVNHIALRVGDLDAAEQFIGRAFGIDTVVRWPEEYGLMPGEESIGVFWLGDLYFELIQQASPLPEAPTGGMPTGHLVEIGFFVNDLDAEVARLAKIGYEVLWRGGGRGVNFAHLDSTPPAGIPVELIEVTPEMSEVVGE